MARGRPHPRGPACCGQSLHWWGQFMARGRPHPRDPACCGQSLHWWGQFMARGRPHPRDPACCGQSLPCGGVWSDTTIIVCLCSPTACRSPQSRGPTERKGVGEGRGLRQVRCVCHTARATKINFPYCAGGGKPTDRVLARYGRLPHAPRQLGRGGHWGCTPHTVVRRCQR